MSDILRLTMIFPFLLKWFLDVNMIKNDIIRELRQQNSLQRGSQVITMIIQCWINFAVLAKLVFTSTLQNSDYARLDQLSKDFTNIVLKVKLYNDFYLLVFDFSSYFILYNVGISK